MKVRVIPEDLATEDFAIAISTLAILGVCQYDEDDEYEEDRWRRWWMLCMVYIENDDNGDDDDDDVHLEHKWNEEERKKNNSGPNESHIEVQLKIWLLFLRSLFL